MKTGSLALAMAKVECSLLIMWKKCNLDLKKMIIRFSVAVGYEYESFKIQQSRGVAKSWAGLFKSWLT